VLDAAGNVYITGFFAGSVALGNNLSLEGGPTTVGKTFVVRYSPQGTAEWAQQTNTGLISSALGSGIGIDAAGVVTVAGFCSRAAAIGASSVSAPNNGSGTFLARFLGASGALQSLTLGVYYAPPTGPGGTYYYPRLTVAPDGTQYLLTNFSQPVVAGAGTLISRGDVDVLVARYSAQGVLEWVQQFGGTAGDAINDGAVDAAGNLYLTGAYNGQAAFDTFTLTSAGDFDGYLLKLAPSGTLPRLRRLERPSPGCGRQPLPGRQFQRGSPGGAGHAHQRRQPRRHGCGLLAPGPAALGADGRRPGLRLQPAAGL
jgi:hypothetical protein